MALRCRVTDSLAQKFCSGSRASPIGRRGLADAGLAACLAMATRGTQADTPDSQDAGFACEFPTGGFFLFFPLLTTRPWAFFFSVYRGPLQTDRLWFFRQLGVPRPDRSSTVIPPTLSRPPTRRAYTKLFAPNARCRVWRQFAAKMSNADFLGRAIEQVKKAIETDTAGDYEKAYQLYYQARG